MSYADAIETDFTCGHQDCPRCRRMFEHEDYVRSDSGCTPDEPDPNLLCMSCERETAQCLTDCPSILADVDHAAACEAQQ